MRLLIVLLLVALCASEIQSQNWELRYKNRHVFEDFQQAFNGFTITLYKTAANRSNNFFVISPQAAWITLAAIAEGADRNNQQKLFQLLNLPQNPSTRQRYYQIATSRITPVLYVNIFNTRTLLIDQRARITSHWYAAVKRHSLLEVISAPIKDDPNRTKQIIKLFTQLENNALKFNRHSVLLNTMDYNGLWTTAFRHSMIMKAPFYNLDGQRIGSVDLMKDKRRVRIGYMASLNAKFLELPIGSNGEYRMVFALSANNNSRVDLSVANINNRTMLEMVASLQDSYVPIEIAIPRMLFNTDINMKDLLKDLGIVDLWQNPFATRPISTPPAYPTNYFQRATITMNKAGIKPPTFDYHWFLRAPDNKWHDFDFVADRPFMFGLFDAETYTCLMAALFTKPTYPN